MAYFVNWVPRPPPFSHQSPKATQLTRSESQTGNLRPLAQPPRPPNNPPNPHPLRLRQYSPRDRRSVPDGHVRGS
jgi:hypothetical protein